MKKCRVCAVIMICTALLCGFSSCSKKKGNSVIEESLTSVSKDVEKATKKAGKEAKKAAKKAEKNIKKAKADFEKKLKD